MQRIRSFAVQLRQDAQESCDRVRKMVSDIRPKRRHNMVGVISGDQSPEWQGRVWVEVGGTGTRLRVVHLHPTNPAVVQVLLEQQAKFGRNSTDDDISLASMEDYWFNHWQGPIIVDENVTNVQNNFRRAGSSRHSFRNSKKLRCSVCHKKVVNVEGPCDEGAIEEVVAHLPLVRIESRPVDFGVGVSDDESTCRPEENLSCRFSASDEQLARAHRVVDMEFRTTSFLFDEEDLTQDVLDGGAMGVRVQDDGVIPDPRRPTFGSRSCPCSPRLSRGTNTAVGTEMPSKPRQRSASTHRFSLSGSLLAIHRQASEYLGTQTEDRASLDQVSMPRNNGRRASDARSATLRPGSSLVVPSTLQASVSLPALKLSKMAMTYRKGVLTYKDTQRCPLVPSTLEETEGGAGVGGWVGSDEDGGFVLLPDVVPRHRSSEGSQTDSDRSSLSEVEGTINQNNPVVINQGNQGVINLGFDGNEAESSTDDPIDEPSVASGSSGSWSIGKSSEGSWITRKRSVTVNLCMGGNGGRGVGRRLRRPLLVPQVAAMANGNSASPSVTPSPAAPSIPATTISPIKPSAPMAPVEMQESQEHLTKARAAVLWWCKQTLVDNNEFCLSYTECKVKQKPVLFFVHGLGGSCDQWRQQMWYFVQRGYEVVAPDLLGHGSSSAPKVGSQYHFSHLLEQITLVFDLFVPAGRKCVVIGHDYGCSLATALARCRPLCVRLLVLASGGGPCPLVPRPPGTFTQKQLMVLALSRPLLSCGCVSREILYTPRGKHFEVTNSKGACLTYALSTPPHVLHHAARGQDWPEGDVAFHRRLTVPTLLLYGLRDCHVSLVEMCEMERTIPRAFLELIPTAGHELMTDASEDVNEAIHRFLKRWKHCL